MLQEFLLNLDSHKNLVVSLNIVGKHLAEHTEDEARADELRQRLVVMNRRWDQVCNSAAIWQTLLQSALMEVNYSQSVHIKYRDDSVNVVITVQSTLGVLIHISIYFISKIHLVTDIT